MPGRPARRGSASNLWTPHSNPGPPPECGVSILRGSRGARMDSGRCREPSGTRASGAARLAAPTRIGARTRLKAPPAFCWTTRRPSGKVRRVSGVSVARRRRNTMARRKLSVALAGLAVGLLACAAPAYGQSKHLKNAATGDPQVKSIQALGFGPDGLLLIGDGKGAQLVAIDTGDTTMKAWTKTDIPDIAGQLAGRLGTTAKGITITRLAVNPASTVAYFAVRKTDDKSDVIL